MKDPIISSELHPNPETKNKPTGVWSSQEKEAYVLTNNDPYPIGITSITYEDKQYYVGDNVELTIVVEEGHTLDSVSYYDDEYSGDFVEDPAGTFKGTIKLTKVVNDIEVKATVTN